MGKKKPLEFDLRDTPDERYAAAGKRLELRAVDGTEHRDFSHETGAIKIDNTGREEFEKKAEQARQERAARTKNAVEAEKAKLDKFTRAYLPDEENQGMRLAASTGRFLAVGIGIYFSLTAFCQIYFWAKGTRDAGAPTWGTTVILLVVSAAIFTFSFLPQKTARVMGRFLYAGGLIYFGLLGANNLINLYRNPPARGVNWTGLPFSMASMALLGYGIRVLWRTRKNFLVMYDEPEGEFGKKNPFFQNLDHLDLLIYTLEGAMVMCALGFCAAMFLGLDIFSLALICYRSPPIFFLVAYPFFAYLFFRKYSTSMIS